MYNKLRMMRSYVGLVTKAKGENERQKRAKFLGQELVNDNVDNS